MFYKKIVLKGFKRTIEPNITIEPHSSLQLILGPNGCGKTSLIKEICPLPPDKDSYFKDGFKELEITHNNNLYILRYEFQNTLNCYFYKQDENGDLINLNQGRTQSAQIKLAEQIFNYNKYFHNLIYGIEKFTDMTPQRRREYFTYMCDVNYDYAIDLWKKYKDNLRDVQGALKRIKHNLLEETKNSNNDDTSAFEKEIKQNEEEIKVLQDNIITVSDESINDLETKANELLEGIKNTSKILIKARTFLEKQTPQLSKKELEYNIQLIDNETIKLNGELVQLEKRFNDLDVEKQKSVGISNETYNNKKNIVKELELKQNELKDNFNNYINLDNDKEIHLYTDINIDYNNLLDVIDLIAPKIINLLNTFPDVKEISTNETINELELIINKNSTELNNLQNNQNKIIGTIDEMKKLKDNDLVTCPECNYTWIPNYDENRLNDNLSKLELISTEINKLEKTINTLTETLNIKKQWKRCYDILINKIEEYNLFKNYLWKYFTNENLINKKDFLINKVNDIKEDLQWSVKYQKLSKEKHSLEKELENSKVSDNDNINLLNKKIKNVEEEVLVLQDKKQQLNEKREVYRKKLSANNALEKNHESLKNLFKNLTKSEYELIGHTYKNEIMNNIRSKRAKIYNLSDKINQIKGRQNIINEYKKQINELEQEENTIKIIVKELSPSSGLIADGLICFIDNFLINLNNVIKKVWTYPLNVKLPSIDENICEVNYKFPIEIGEKDDLVPDINNGSTGIKEIINVAFKLVAMKKSGMEDYPLFLDESGASFDLKHREQIGVLIKAILDNNIHEQIFMVSHYMESYGSLVSADVVVLSKDNILIPKQNYNEYVKFTD